MVDGGGDGARCRQAIGSGFIEGAGGANWEGRSGERGAPSRRRAVLVRAPAAVRLLRGNGWGRMLGGEGGAHFVTKKARPFSRRALVEINRMQTGRLD